MRHRLIPALLALAAPAVAHAQGAERIGQDALPGFVSGHRETAAAGSIEEFVPRGETVQSWTRMVTVLRLTGVAAQSAPVDYARAFVAGLPASCPDSRIGPPEAIRIGNRPAARTWVRCPLLPTTGLPETFYMVAVAGAADMHVVQIAFRRVPTEADLDFAAGQLESVRLCTAGSREAVCATR